MTIIARAVLAGLAVLFAGNVAWGLALAPLNLRLWPSVPWAVVPMAAYLWVYWGFFGGRLGLSEAAAWRREQLRAEPVGGDVWPLALISGLAGFAALLTFVTVMARLVPLPTPAAIIAPAGMPRITVIVLLVMASVFARVTEEAAFRGYMQGPIERRYGVAIAILINGVMFGLLHFPNHPAETLTMLARAARRMSSPAWYHPTEFLETSKMRHLIAGLLVAAGVMAAVAGTRVEADDAERLLTIDHYVRVKSTVPAIAGQPAQLYVRERAKAGVIARGSPGAGGGDRVLLFVHGAGTPAEVSFDVSFQDYSWMVYLANAGYDVFSVDMSGYGRSVRPAPMNDPCNLRDEQQKLLIGRLLSAPCAPPHPQSLTTMASDWDDLGAAVDYVRALRRVDTVSLFGWSLGGPRAGGYTAQHPDKVNRLVLLAPAYQREMAAGPPTTSPQTASPASSPNTNRAFNTQSRAEFLANWDRQVGCPAQYDPAAAEAVWSEMLESDPVGATWGPGVRRAPNTATFGWNAEVVARTKTPILMVSPPHDKQVPPERVRDLYADIGSTQKVLLDLACSSHAAMWETKHTLLFRASLEWLEKGTVNGQQQGTVRLGYADKEGK